jgi:hypothetical protein
LPKEQTPIDGIRVCFKKNAMEEGMVLARVINSIYQEVDNAEISME